MLRCHKEGDQQHSAQLWPKNKDIFNLELCLNKWEENKSQKDFEAYLRIQNRFWGPSKSLEVFFFFF